MINKKSISSSDDGGIKTKAKVRCDKIIMTEFDSSKIIVRKLGTFHCCFMINDGVDEKLRTVSRRVQYCSSILQGLDCGRLSQ